MIDPAPIVYGLIMAAITLTVLRLRAIALRKDKPRDRPE